MTPDRHVCLPPPLCHCRFRRTVPPAKCSSIPGANITRFCADHGANGLVDTAATTDCAADPCVKVADAAVCCKTAAGDAPDPP